MSLTILLVIIGLALVFDYINGFHDAANAIATIVATKVLTPFQAVLWAAFFNFLAFWVFGFGVADTVAKTANTMDINLVVILAGVIAAIIWNLATWWFGIPSSSSHTLIGGFAGAAIAHAGLGVVNWYKEGKAGEMPSGVLVIIGFIVLAPFIGAFVSYFISVWLLHSSKKSIWPKIFTSALMLVVGLLIWFELKSFDSIKDPRFPGNPFLSIITEPHNIKWLLVGFIVFSVSFFCLIFSSLNQTQSTAWLRKMQLISSASFSLGHGGNDSQKVMGIIAAAVVVYIHKSGVSMAELPVWLHVDLPSKAADGHEIAGHMPDWIPLACYGAIAIGTLSGGWKIVKTMGSKITKVTAFEGVSAETAGALTLYFTEHLKIPVSTTHTITGSIIGSGLTKGVSAVKWGVTVKLIWAWVLTIPVSAALAAGIYYLLSIFIK
ncbi:MAG: inorganic phosphate transporter [Sphingobacteriaceae bacterium]|nr:inorganic phosphate transporter [Sphingobacteriaceae bacterium]